MTTHGELRRGRFSWLQNHVFQGMFDLNYSFRVGSFQWIRSGTR